MTERTSNNAVGEISFVVRISTPLLSHYRCKWRIILSLFVSLIGRCTGLVQLIFTEILWSFKIIKGHFLISSKCLSDESVTVTSCTHNEPRNHLGMTRCDKSNSMNEKCVTVISRSYKIETNYNLQCMTATCDVWIRYHQSALKECHKN